ncbi:organic anion transporter 3-like isoform X2 [Convolutriloba macropyga]|uniref:organic anion transporter 3-like isoform X2 n=1 Tax=Convolutriloba macropyga TaxID=536237 RepID=UPI003F51EA1C
MAIDEREKGVDDEDGFVTHIVETTGYCNKWHLLIFIGVAIVAVQDAANMMWPIFAAAHIPHRCRISGLQTLPFQNVPEELINEVFFKDPNAFGCSGVVGDMNSGCTALNVSTDSLVQEAEGLNVSLAELLSQPKEKSQVLSVAEWRRCDQMEGYEWMPTEVMDSVVSEFELVCGGEIYRRIDKSLFVLGQCFGAFMLGYLADAYGRKTILVVQFLLETVFVVGMALSNDIKTVIILRFIVSMFNMAKYPIAVTVGAEVMLQGERAKMGLVPGIEYEAGMVLYTVFGYYIRTWRLFTTSGMWLCLPVVLYWAFVMPESPRWLLEQGKFRKFKKVAKDIEDKTNKTFDPKMWQKLEHLIECEEESAVPMTFKDRMKAFLCKKRKKGFFSFVCGNGPQPCISLVKDSLLRKWLLVLSFAWTSNMMLYYALTMGQDLFNLNLYSYTLLSGLFEIPGVIVVIVILDYVGRKVVMSGALILCSLSLIMCRIFSDTKIALLIFASLSKLFVTGSYDLVFLYTGELLPTLSRATGMGICNAVARLVGMSFPFIDMLNTVVDGASLAFMITLAILSALVILILPETKGQELPETVDECYLLAQGKLKKSGAMKASEEIEIGDSFPSEEAV